MIDVVSGCGPDAGAPLARSRDVDVHSFAGSTATGRRITQASAGSVKRRRLGGKSASVVFDDADLDAALDGVLLGVFCNNGDANSTEYGLAGSIWTNNIDKALPVAREMRSGRFWINTTIDGAPQLPAGGMNQSGLGREMGQAGFEEFTEPKTIQFAAS